MEVVDANYKEARGLVLGLRRQLAQLATGQDKSIFLQGTLATGVKTLTEICTKLQEDVGTVPASKRELWTIKVQQLVAEYHELKRSVESQFYEINRESQEEEERRKLFGDRDRDSRDGQMHMGEELKRWTDMSHSLSNTQRIALEIQNMATGIAHAISDQNVTLKKIHRTVMDLVNTFETARSVMRMIEKRQYTDKMIVYAGIFIILVFLAIMWWYK